MRLFISINPPHSVRMQLDEWLPDIPGIRKTPVDQLHLTLLFLGDVEPERIPGITDSLKQVEFTPFEMIVRGVGAFPNQNKPRIIWAGVEKSSKLMSVYNQVFKTLNSYLSERQNLTFKPHITLARVRQVPSRTSLDDFFQKNKTLRFDVNEFTLKQSELKPTGSQHKVLNRFGSV